MTGHVVWLRHGMCRDGQQRPEAHPHPDSPLDPRGRTEVAGVIAQFRADGRQFEQVIASPLPRALTTASIVAAALDIPLHPPASVLAEWRPPDCVLGRAPADYPPAYRQWRAERHTQPDTALPGGESLTAFTQRAHAAQQLVTELADTGSLLVVSHRVLIGAIAALGAGHRDPPTVFAQAAAFPLRTAGTWIDECAEVVRPAPTPRPAAPPDWPG